MAEFLGLMNYPVVVVEHPLSNNTDAELRAKAELTTMQAVAIWRSASREA
jgi:hypothetical protein